MEDSAGKNARGCGKIGKIVQLKDWIPQLHLPFISPHLGSSMNSIVQFYSRIIDPKIIYTSRIPDNIMPKSVLFPTPLSELVVRVSHPPAIFAAQIPHISTGTHLPSSDTISRIWNVCYALVLPSIRIPGSIYPFLQSRGRVFRLSAVSILPLRRPALTICLWTACSVLSVYHRAYQYH